MPASSTATGSKRLRVLLARGRALVPCCFDAFTAHLVPRTGFGAVYISGLAVEASQFGSPDIGLITPPEMISHAARIAEAVDLPVTCDADAGFGDGLQIRKMVCQFARAGLAATHIEDQASRQGQGYAAANVLAVDAARARVQPSGARL